MVGPRAPRSLRLNVAEAREGATPPRRSVSIVNFRAGAAASACNAAIRRMGRFAAAALVAAGCANAQAPAWQARSLSHDGQMRRWSEIVPAACAERRARCPVLVALHGGGGTMNGAQFADGTGLATEGSARGYVVLAPDALGANWNDGRPELA